MSNLNNHDEKDIEEDDDDDEEDDDYVPVNDNESEEENENLKNELVEDRLTDNEEEDDDYKIKNKKPKLIKNDDDESKSKKTDEIWSSFKNDVKSASSITNTCSKEIGNINNTQINNKTVATSKSITSTNTTNLVKTRPKGGIAGILNKINKQPKISTLEKSRLDWEEFKKSENIEDDLTKHSKGKESYLERRAFLERADYREYEIEKGLRTKERKLRETH